MTKFNILYKNYIAKKKVETQPPSDQKRYYMLMRPHLYNQDEMHE